MSVQHLSDSQFLILCYVDLQAAIQDIGDLAKHVGIFLELCGSREPQTAETSAECLVLILKASPRLAAGPILSNTGRLVNVLETCSQVHAPPLLAQLQRRLLFAISSSCKEQREAHANKEPLPAPSPSNSDFVSLENVVVRMRKSSLPQVAEAAVNAAYEMQRMPRSSS